MGSQGPDPDMFTKPFQLTKAMHRDVYPSVDPKSPELRVEGKVVLITGAAGGIGYAIAKAWSAAGAAGITLVGRNAATLEKAAQTLQSPYLVVRGDVAKEEDLKAAFDRTVAEFGRVDVVISTAANMTMDVMTGDATPTAWFSDLETNLKGMYNLAYHFMRTNGGKGTFINISSLAAALSIPGNSTYAVSKLAGLKLAEALHIEHPNLRVFSIHPGIVEPEGGRGAVTDAFVPFAKDKQALSAGVTLYLQKPEADVLRGGFFSVNWSVDEMVEHGEELKNGELLKLGFVKGQLGPEGHPWKKV
ncbi:hypothetical protein LTR56_014361 [Elasticomyces elasticus]|nr:hypothetical protein LTR56_014361 [Elasticomyces elasticus]KAK3636350.1 hypothetical protein LTR22_018726 [Elasticomyces elasticus]KAK4916617.1 hypothetical protein LTR49_015450 [Elasticomyces elasticus]